MRHHILRTGRRVFGRNRVAKRVWRRISPTLRSKTKVLLQREAYRKAYRQPIQPDVVLYEAYAGKGLQCNPHAIFRHLLAQPDLAHLRHVWVLNDLSAHRARQAEFAGHPRVRFVQFRSDAYFQHLATARFLVNNVTFPFEFTKRPGQTYLNTWHGVPMKQLGYEVPSGAFYSRNVVRNFLNADYLPEPALSAGDVDAPTRSSIRTCAGKRATLGRSASVGGRCIT
jgi:CDP-glycerol glycerophosphotransferase (TagB/SpsB family)